MGAPLASIEPLLPALRERPLGLFSDVDGTLAPIVSRPEDATVPTEIRSLLAEMAGRGVMVALITGRSLEMARAMVGLDGVVYAAEHGLTVWSDGVVETVPGIEEYGELARQAERDLSELTRAAPGVQLENKGPLLAVHYRRAADPEARERILEAVARSTAAGRFRIHEGRKVIELRPPVDIDKGTALESLARRSGLRAALCLGDDITDLDMFDALRRLQGEGLAGAALAVVSEDSAPEVREAADYELEGVERVEWLLREIVTTLP